MFKWAKGTEIKTANEWKKEGYTTKHSGHTMPHLSKLYLYKNGILCGVCAPYWESKNVN